MIISSKNYEFVGFHFKKQAGKRLKICTGNAVISEDNPGIQCILNCSAAVSGHFAQTRLSPLQKVKNP